MCGKKAAEDSITGGHSFIECVRLRGHWGCWDCVTKNFYLAIHMGHSTGVGSVCIVQFVALAST